MSTHDPGRGLPADDPRGGLPADERPPVLPRAGAANPALDRLVRENLRRLAEVTEDPALQRRMREVVAGRASLRELAFSGDFQSFLEPLVESGLRHWQSLPESQRETYAEQGLRGDLPLDADRAGGPHADGGDGVGGDSSPGDGAGGDDVPGTGRGPAGTW